MFPVVLHILGFTASLLASITVRDFSLVTDKGEDVFQAVSDRRQLQDSIMDRIALTFNAMEKNFEFKLERSHPIFAPGATIEMTGRVRKHKKADNSALSKVICRARVHIYTHTHTHTHTHACTAKRLSGSFTTRNFVILQSQK